MRRRKHSAQLDPMLVGLLAESAEWLKRYDLRAQHDLLYGEYSRLHQRAIAIRWSDPLEHDRLMTAAREIREQRDTCMRQLIDLPAEPHGKTTPARPSCQRELRPSGRVLPHGFDTEVTSAPL